MRAAGKAASLAAATLIAALSACHLKGERSPVENAPETAEKEGGPWPSSAGRPTGQTIAYRCSNGKRVVATYGVDFQSPDKQVAELVIDGKTLRLSQSVNTAENEFETDYGPRPGKRLVWWVKDGASWYEGPRNSDQEVVVLVAECSEVKPR